MSLFKSDGTPIGEPRLDTNFNDEVIERCKSEKVVLTQADLGEVSKDDATLQIFAVISGISFKDLRYGYITADDWQDMAKASSELQDANIWFDVDE